MKALSTLPLAAVLALPATAKPQFTQETLPLPAIAPFRAVIKRPRSAKGRLPALIILGGVETGSRALDVVEPDRPMVLAGFDYPYAGPTRFQFPRTILDAPKIKAAAQATTKAVLQLRQALAQRPDVDPAKICAVAASFGTPFILSAAAQEPALACLVIVHGFADVEGTARARLQALWTDRLGSLAKPAAWVLAKALKLYLRPPKPEADATKLGRGQRVLVVEAAEDELLPARSRKLLWQALQRSQAQVSRVVLPGGHLMIDEAATQVRQVAAVAEPWLYQSRSTKPK